ncbi:hypothetical protein [Chryseobacterium pennae]|nr:hypothetical protein [Chryseobacterium pennae]
MMGAATKGTEMIAGAMTHAAFNLGNALGAFLGGFPIDAGYDFNYSSLVGVLMTLIGVALNVWYIKRHKRKEKVKAIGFNN